MSRPFSRFVVVLLVTLLVVAIVAGAATARPAKVSLKAQLGAAIAYDTDLSNPVGQSCADCHDPLAGFADPDKKYPVSEGATKGLFGGRNAPSWAYTAWSPVLYYDETEGLWIGGMFWDGRATGWSLGMPLAEQAQGPFLNPVEMNMGDEAAVIDAIRHSDYADMFVQVFPHTDWETEAGIGQAYDDMAFAIAEYEASRAVNPFSSRFDAYMAGTDGALSEQELWGLELFNGKGKCNLCHLSEPTMDVAVAKALFTDHTYDNLGIPANPEVWALAGSDAVDLGLGGFLASQPTYADMAADENGKFKVPTLRNIAKTPPYGHNGYFDTLYDIVHFYNTRDVDPMWPAPEYPDTMNTEELGNLELTYEEELAVVAFMKSLTDRAIMPQPGR
jgi:cytochrome c peroxidase